MPRKAGALVKAVEDEVLQVKGIRDVVSNSAPSGVSSGPAMGDIGGGGSKPVDAIGTLNLELDDYCCRRPSKEIFAEIRKRTADIPGIRIQVAKMEGGPPTGKDVNLQITSASYDQVATRDRSGAPSFRDGSQSLRDRGHASPARHRMGVADRSQGSRPLQMPRLPKSARWCSLSPMVC